MNLSMKQNQRHGEQTCGERVSGGMEQEVGVSKCKLLYIGQINNQTLLYSTENYIQYPMINHNGKEYLKKNIYIQQSFYCMAIINIANQLHFN